MKYILFVTTILCLSCQSQGTKSEPLAIQAINYQSLDTATFAGGCFWCVEASFEQIRGVISAVSGYSGGKESNAKYNLVSSGSTNHAEAVQVFYDPKVINYETLLDIFFTAHDPTQVNRQGPDVGTQYRSAIFYHNDSQKEIAKSKIEELSSSFSKPIATELSELTKFYEAEEYHQDYERKNPYNPYILSVSKPKINRVKERFKDILKEEEQ